MDESPVLFSCERQNARLTAPGCSRMWRSARDTAHPPKPWEGRSACLTCRIGAMNSGEQISAVAEEVAILSKICPRCLQQAERIINDSLCISCYNRAREAQLGRNAKGGTPQLCARLHDIDMAVLADGELRVTTAHRTVGAAEAIIGIARHAETALAFGWVASGPGNQEVHSHE